VPLIALVVLLSAAAGDSQDEVTTADTIGDAGLAADSPSLSDFRFVIEAWAGGDAFASLTPRSVADAVWAHRALSPWGGLRAGAVRLFSPGVFAGGDMALAGNREDAGNSVVGEVRYRGLLSVRGLAGYRLELAGAAVSPYTVVEGQALLGARQLGVFGATRVSPLFGGGLRGGVGLWLEIWLFSLRVDGGLGLALGGVQAFGTAAAGVTF
jgi:hypothetical protein